MSPPTPFPWQFFGWPRCELSVAFFPKPVDFACAGRLFLCFFKFSCLVLSIVKILLENFSMRPPPLGLQKCFRAVFSERFFPAHHNHGRHPKRAVLVVMAPQLVGAFQPVKLCMGASPDSFPRQSPRVTGTPFFPPPLFNGLT